MNRLQVEPFLHRLNNNLYINCSDLNTVILERKNQIFNPHKLNFYCIQLCLDGQGIYWVDFKPVELKAKQVLIVSKNQIGQFQEPINFNSKVLIFTEDFFCIDELHFQFFYSTNLFNLSSSCSSVDIGDYYHELTILFDLIKNELNKESYINQQQILNNYLFNVLLILEKTTEHLHSLNVSQEKLIVSSFKVLVNKKMDKSISMKDYASELNLSVRTIEYAFNKVNNMTPYTWVCDRFIMEIKRYLLYKNTPINVISNLLGFKEANHLTIFFKKQTGLTPRQFKSKFNF